MRYKLTLYLIACLPFLSMAQNFYDEDEKASLLGGSVGMAFPGGESDPELNASAIYLYHTDLTTGLALEVQAAAVISTAASYADGWKFILPVDSRVFLGSRKFSSFAGVGLQYTTVSPGDREYDDPRLNQLASNIALGLKAGFWKERRHSIMLGTKAHLPMCGSDGLYDKSTVAIIAGIGFTNSWGAIKIDYEYPFGKEFSNSVYGINSQSMSVAFLFNI